MLSMAGTEIVAARLFCIGGNVAPADAAPNATAACAEVGRGLGVGVEPPGGVVPVVGPPGVTPPPPHAAVASVAAKASIQAIRPEVGVMSSVLPAELRCADCLPVGSRIACRSEAARLPYGRPWARMRARTVRWWERL